MIRLQIVERDGANLYQTLKRAMRSKELQTFALGKGGRRVTHKNVNYPGWMTWSSAQGAITCEIVSPREPGSEWRFLSALMGRLADRYAGLVHSVHVEFPGADGEALRRLELARKAAKRARTKRRRAGSKGRRRALARKRVAAKVKLRVRARARAARRVTRRASNRALRGSSRRTSRVVQSAARRPARARMRRA